MLRRDNYDPIEKPKRIKDPKLLDMRQNMKLTPLLLLLLSATAPALGQTTRPTTRPFQSMREIIATVPPAYRRDGTEVQNRKRDLWFEQNLVGKQAKLAGVLWEAKVDELGRITLHLEESSQGQYIVFAKFIGTEAEHDAIEKINAGERTGVSGQIGEFQAHGGNLFIVVLDDCRLESAKK